MCHALAFAAVLLAVPFRPDLPPIARLYAERAGASGGFPGDRPVRLTYRAREYGLEGTLVEERVGGALLSHLIVPPLDETLLADGAQIKRRDWNGQVTDVGGLDRADVLAGLAVDRGTWLADASKVSTLPDDAQRRPRLRVALAAPVELTFSRDGDLVERRILRTQGAEVTSYDDWAVVAGLRLPRHVTVHQRNIDEPLERWLTAAEPLPRDHAVSIPASREDVHLPVGQDRIELPLSLLHELWLQTSVEVAGRSAIFLIDTGASSTVVDEGFAAQLGLAPVGHLTQTSGLFKQFRFVTMPAVAVGGARFDPQTLITVDLVHSPIGSYFPGVVGILGYDFLSRFVFVADYPASRLSLVSRAAFEPMPDDVPIPTVLDGTDAVVEVRVAGQPARFVVDTGSGGGVLLQHVEGQAQLVTSRARRFYDPEGSHFGSGAPAGTWPAQADVQIGPFLWRKAPVVVLDPGTAKGSSFDQGGNIGAAYLRDFRVSLDLATGRLWLAQGIPFRHRPLASYGLQLDHEGPRIVVRSVATAGPAARAGLKKGDEIAAINGLAAGGGRFLEGALVRPEAGEAVDLQIDRAGQGRSVRVRAEQVFGPADVAVAPGP